MGLSYVNSRGNTYYLHSKTVTLPNGTRMPVYSLTRTPKPAEALAQLPEGYVVLERKGTAVPYLKRSWRHRSIERWSTGPCPCCSSDR